MPKHYGKMDGGDGGMRRRGGSMHTRDMAKKSMMMDSRGNGAATNRNVKTTPGPIMPNYSMKK